MSDFGGSITIPASMLRPTPTEADMEAEMREAAKSLGHAYRMHLRKVARDCGLATLPGCIIHFCGEAIIQPSEDVTQLLPGEEP